MKTNIFVASATLALLTSCSEQPTTVDPALTAKAFPDPSIVMPAENGDQTAVLAGGCFWTQEAVFEHIKGIKSVVSGYAGGDAATATYDQVATRGTGHAESVKITYDPSQISYGHILKIFLAASHDPTQLNRQGPDVGSDYRSAIFVQSPDQQRVAEAYLKQIEQAGIYDDAVVTKIEKGTFYPAEEEHQNFVERNPDHPYVLAHDVEKLAKLKKAFPEDWRNQTTS